MLRRANSSESRCKHRHIAPPEVFFSMRLKGMPFRERLAWYIANQPANECWDWPGFKSDGYGKVSVNLDERGWRCWFAHRAAYTIAHGPVDPRMEIDHLCRNRGCFNPAHLEAVSPRENALRSNSPTAKNAQKTHCKNGHPFDETNTYWFETKYGTPARACRQCTREMHQRNQRKYALKRTEKRRAEGKKERPWKRKHF